MNRKTLFLSSLLALLAVLPAAVIAENRAAQYGRWEDYASGDVLSYPDFDLKFSGTEPGPFYPGSKERRLGQVFRFVVIRRDIKQEVTWSTGTGDIGPSNFSIGSERYLLELLRSASLGRDPSGSGVVVWRRSDWEKARQ